MGLGLPVALASLGGLLGGGGSLLGCARGRGGPAPLPADLAPLLAGDLGVGLAASAAGLVAAARLFIHRGPRPSSGFVLVNTALGRQKTRNVTRDPRVTVGVFDIANPYDYVSVSGRVVKKVTGKAADDHIDKLAMKYMGSPKYGRRDPSEKRVILMIQPSKSV